jgi:TonB-linked SusC/RagA family outer membrane protein
MKKSNTGWTIGDGLRKTLFIMKLSVALMFLCLTQLSATIYSQNTKLSISGKNLTVKAILKEIEEQSEFKFLYRKDQIDDEIALNINEQNRTVEDILDNVFVQHENVTYTVLEDNLIVISLKQEGILIRGRVVDASDNEPIPGVNVYIKGSPQSGTVTGLDGKYTINVKSDEDTIVYSFIGYLSEEIVVGNQTTINASLVPDIQELDEVVVVGYGTMRRSDLTGSVSSVKEEDLSSVASSSIDNMLSGKVAGLTARMNSAQPGGGVEVLVRGGASGAGNEPLYVVDGFPISNDNVEPVGGRYSSGSRSPLSSLNPNDIASIEVLKDASATAIYGARAANGVILITTKRGKEGTVNVNYDVNYSLQAAKNPYELLNEKDFMIERNRYYQDTWYKSFEAVPFGSIDTSIVNVFPYEPPFSQEEIDNAGEGTDWFKEVTRTGKIQDHNLTVQSGSENTKYYASFNFFDQKGILKNIDFTRYAGRLNIDQKINNWIDLGINLSGTYITNNNSQMSGVNDKSGLLSSAYQYPATIQVRDSDGKYVLNPERPVLPNPASLLEITDITTTQRYLSRAFLKIRLIKGLFMNPSIGYDSDMGKRSRYLPKTTLFGSEAGGSASINEMRRSSLIFENTLNYNKEFNDFKLDALLGMSYQDFKGEGFNAGNQDFLTDLLLYNDMSVGEKERPDVDSWKNFEAMASYFGRVHFSYKSKYMLTLTVRRDGSTKFGKGNRYGIFPSGAFAYRIIQEDFMQQQSVFSDLKFRVSYGQTGNSNIGQSALALISAGHSYPFNNTVSEGMYKSQLGNSNLRWETNTELNFGIDFGLFGNRIWGNAEYFNKIISDLLDERTLPSYFPVSSAPDNIGKRQSSGVELTIQTQNLTGAFRWSTDITLTSFKDRWKERNPDVILNIYEQADGPLHAIYGYKTDGLTYPSSDPTVSMESLYPHLANPLPGELNIVDLNGMDTLTNSLSGQPDGAISDADKVLLGTTVPKLSFGLNNRFEYRNFDLNIYIYGMLGLTVYNKTKAEMTKGSMLDYNTNQLEEIKDRYSPYTNPDGTIPIGIRDQYWGSSDYFIEDASFVRIKSITLGYTFNQLFNNKIKSLRLYIDLNNVYVFTKYSGSDPETESGAQYDDIDNYDNMASYPFPLTTSFGASVKF